MAQKSCLYPGALPPHKYSETIDKLKEEVLPLLKSDDNWTFYHEADSVKVWTQQTEKSQVPAVKGLCTINGTPEQVRCVFTAFELRSEWDDTFISCQPVEIINPRVGVFCSRFKAPWPLTNREFLTISQVEFVDGKDNEFMAINANLDEHPQQPLDSKFVRGTVYFMTWWARPNATDPTKTDITYIVLQSPGGSIPNAVVSYTVPKMPAVLAKVKNLVENNPTFVERAIKVQEEKAKKVLEMFKM